MKKEKAYCEQCDEDVSYFTKCSTRNATIRGDTFIYPFIEAYCQNCSEPVFPVSISHKNTIAMYDEYKKRHDLLTSEQIINIRKKLNMSQKEFAKYLGCGEKTITRYENGAIQDRIIDNFMRLIDKMEHLLAKDKDIALLLNHI